jgi:hypothetical protein
MIALSPEVYRALMQSGQAAADRDALAEAGLAVALRATWTGTVGHTLAGTWTQGEASAPLNLAWKGNL